MWGLVGVCGELGQVSPDVDIHNECIVSTIYGVGEGVTSRFKLWLCFEPEKKSSAYFDMYFLLLLVLVNTWYFFT